MAKKIEFWRAAKFPHASDKEKELFFSIGIHDVPEHVLAHPYFKMLLADGHVGEPDLAKMPLVESQVERNKRLVKAVQDEAAAKAEAAGEITAEIEVDDDADEEVKKTKKHSKHR